jgi:hypothetical protein
MANVHDVATYILSKQGGMTTIELQNLVCHAASCSPVWVGKLSFPERIEPWSMGPVVPDLCARHRPMGMVDTGRDGKPEDRADRHKPTVAAILKSPGKKTLNDVKELLLCLVCSAAQVGPELQPPSARATRTSS